ncbi:MULTISPECIES: outer membrane protein [Parachlamydia]|jgi:hypothetical protein|uniref:Outer membrane protein beta-barrel domain-containing protein n=2 Tax=Parachlamydia acanthamoebae TaxID=83552 RepID=F8KZN0_PARAV|nr:porin family protein [Parachlamydia acanthamoebae]EFB41742.1 hypothetical protein pah_c022o008 [Parachlamydia acanthamoebae str. Hall's coccus]KIA77919.1 hypothetical protein DB43_FK00240 [Parachlamydia acanthamoebae]CCB86375.1 putative uncharacterized protein [Parachlamydia acanthamoebae UV-7]
MKRYYFTVFVIFSTLYLILVKTLTISAEECEDICDRPLPFPHKFYIGPEFYHVHRTREGGTKQNGWIYGGRLGYERIKRFGLYWGVEGHWAQGSLCGHSGNGHKLKSTFTDSNVEGRFGYTLQSKCWYQPSFTPYVGIGYAWEKNAYRHPSPIHLHFLTRFPYWAVGFLSNIEVANNFGVGLNYKAWFMYDARCKVSHDPEFGSTTLKIQDKTNHRVELPITYHYCPPCNHIDIALVPFYESRHYGRHFSFPFSFADTKLTIWGVNLQFIYRL